MLIGVLLGIGQSALDLGVAWIVALIGLGGILLGEQLVPIAKRLADRPELARFVREDCAGHVLGPLPDNRDCRP